MGLLTKAKLLLFGPSADWESERIAELHRTMGRKVNDEANYTVRDVEHLTPMDIKRLVDEPYSAMTSSISTYCDYTV